MSETILAALIAAGSSILVCMISNHYQQKRSEAQHNTTIALMDYKMDQLIHKVELHNNAVERLYEVERKLGIDEEKIDVANHRIHELEQFHK